MDRVVLLPRLAAVTSLACLVLACNRGDRPTVAEPGVAVMPGGSVADPPVAPAPASSASAEPAAAVAPARVTEADFDLALTATGDYHVGQASEVRVVLDSKGSFHVNAEYPYKFKLDPTEGVEYPEAVVGKDAVKLEKTRATMPVKLVPKAAGSRKVAGRFFFSVCTDQKCLVEKRDLALTIEVR